MTRFARLAAAAAIFQAAALGGLARADTIHVDIKGLKYMPAQVSAHVGDTIEWANEDFVVHTATARDGAWDINLPAHKSGKTTLSKVGKVEYYCRFHPNMKGEITITAP